MAGYSGTPLPKKLGMKPGSRVTLVSAPGDFCATLGELPGNVSFVAPTEGAIDVIVCFVRDALEAETRFLELKPKLAWTGGFWMAWEKGVRGKPPALGENTIRDIGLAAGLVDNKVCAIDERRSGLRFVWRVQDRPVESGRKVKRER